MPASSRASFPAPGTGPEVGLNLAVEAWISRSFSLSPGVTNSVTMSDTTTLKLPRRLKTRIARLARQTGRGPHAVMLEALEREISREERLREFVREALATDARRLGAGSPFRPRRRRSRAGHPISRGAGPDRRGAGGLRRALPLSVGTRRGADPR